jgi:endonuclease/exonuclease/phosphatase (EEP) superfamily protein YafD
VVSITPWVLVTSVPLTIMAICSRRWVMTAASAAILLCIIVWEGPVLWPIASAPAAVGRARIRIFDANVAQDNFNLTGIAAEISSAHPNVVTLEELTPPAVSSLKRSGVLADYKWRLVLAAYGAGGMGLWADIPLTGVQHWISDGTQFEIEGWVHPAEMTPVRLDVVHVYAPIGRDEPAEWRIQLTEVRDHLQREPRPLVVTGDFNATADDRLFQRIMGLGLSDAAVLAGRGWEMTWPRDQAWVIPYLRLDHVLLSHSLTVTSYRLGHGAGSDHRPIVVDIAARAIRQDHRK